MMFWLPAVLLMLLAAAFIILPPLLQRRRDEAAREAINLDLYRERLRELEDEAPDPAERAILEEELKRELLTIARDEETAGDEPGVSNVAIPRSVIAVAVLLPLVSIVLFADWGGSWGAVSDVARTEQIAAIDPTTAEGLTDLAGILSETLDNEPGNEQGWFLLGQTYLGLQRFDDALNVFSDLRDRFPDDASVLSNYTEALYLSGDGEITPDVLAAADAALAGNPNDVSMLEIKGMASFRRGDLKGARELFERALPLANPRRAGMISQVIARIDRDLGNEPLSVGRRILVNVEMADHIQLSDDFSLFVYAHAASGPPMPLAIQQLTVGDLPARVLLTEQMAMIPGMGLANFDDVVIVARTSSEGAAAAGPEDWEARSEVIHLPDLKSSVSLTIKSQIKDIRIPETASQG